MRLLSGILSATLLITSSFATEKNTVHRFEDFHRISRQTSPIRLNEATYKSLSTTPRDYSAAILLTALETRFNCQLCREFQPEWDILGRSWANGDKNGQSRLLFGTLDFVEGKDIFIQLGLQTAPVLLLFPPTIGTHAAESPEPLRYDFTAGPSDADIVHSWIVRQLPNRPHPPVVRPVNWLKWVSVGTLVLGITTLVSAIWPYLVLVLQNRALWASISMIAILLFTSGIMFNQIRKVPYVAGDGKGGIQYFVGGFQNQAGLETQIVAAIYGVMTFCVINLAIKVPRNPNPKSQVIASLIWSGLLFLIASFLLSIFRIKNGGYPFALPPFM